MDKLDPFAASAEYAGMGGNIDLGNSAGRTQHPLIQLARHTADLIALCDLDGQLTYLNPAGRKLIGIDGSDIFPLRLTDYVAPEQRAFVDTVIMPAAKRDGVWHGEIKLINLRTDTVIDVERSTFPIADASGQINGFASVMRDVTGARADKARLQREADIFDGLIRDNPFGIYIVDADFKLQKVSRGAQKVFANIDPLLGRDFAEILRIVWREPFASDAIGRFRDTLATGVSFEAPGTVERRADVEAREAYDWRIDRIRLPDGRYGVVCYFYDLTEREAWQAALADREAKLRALSGELEERVRARTLALNQANDRLAFEIERREETQAALLHSQKLEALGQLTSSVAHDFNNILAAVVGGLSLIEARSNDPRVLKVAQLGQDAAQRGATLVAQLLAFAREEALEPRALDIASMLGEARALIRHAVGIQIRLDVQCEEGIWPGYADAAQLQTALLNLAVNARDAMPAGGRISIRAENQPGDLPGHPPELAGADAVAITVSDTGTGIAPNVLQRVTEPFFTTKGVGEGTGLGLAMVKGFVTRSGGALRIESRMGAGTIITLLLPRAAAGGAAPVAPAAVPDEPAAIAGHASLLFVDDDDTLSKIMAEGLRDLGYLVHGAADAKAAMAILEGCAIDAVITDIAMPGTSGIDLVQQIRAARPDLPCLFITGKRRPEQLHAETVLEKPFTVKALGSALGALLIEHNRRFAETVRLDRLAARLRSDCARSLFTHWREQLRTGQLPLVGTFDITRCVEPGRIVIAEVDLGRVPVTFDLVRVGDSLRGAAGVAVDASLQARGSDDDVTREAAYRRCALTGRPSFEYARMDLGDGHIETFERLLLPFSSDGRLVDRIVGAVVIDTETQQDTGR